MPVAGEIKAEDEHFSHIEGLPTETEIAAEVKSLAPNVHGNLMSDDFPVCTTAGNVVKFSIEHGRWKLLKMEDTYSVVDSTTEEAYAGGVYIKSVKKAFGSNHRVVYDANGKPIALAVADAAKVLSRGVTIYGTKQLYEPDKAEHTEDGVQFFPWFRLRDIDANHPEFRSLLAWNGQSFGVMYRVVNAKVHAWKPGSAEWMSPYKEHLMIVDGKDPSVKYAMLSNVKEKEIAGWQVCVAPGVDPLFMLTVAAVLDSMVGWFQ